MKNLKFTIAYNGLAYNGYQSQPCGNTVQDKVEYALSKLMNQIVKINGCSRTDAGVHAIAQVVHFDVDSEIKTSSFGYSINTLLPKDIAITSCEKVSDDFHAQFGAKRKTYLYKICLCKIHSPLKRKYFHVCFYDLDIVKMQDACKYFVGEHDFRAFMLANDEKENTVRTIYNLSVERFDDEVHIRVTGNGFLHNMVRIIAGTLVDVGRGRIAPQDIQKIIASKRHVGTGKTLDPQGLYLESVEYEY